MLVFYLKNDFFTSLLLYFFKKSLTDLCFLGLKSRNYEYKKALLTVVLFASCSKDSQNEEPATQINTEEFTSTTIENARLEQQLEYKTTHLKKLGNWLTQNLK